MYSIGYRFVSIQDSQLDKLEVNVIGHVHMEYVSSSVIYYKSHFYHLIQFIRVR